MGFPWHGSTGILFLEHHGHLHSMVRPHECITGMNIFICLMIIKIVLTILSIIHNIYIYTWQVCFDYIHLYTKIQRYLWLWCWLWIDTIIYTHYFKLILAIPYPVDIKHHHSMFPVTCVSSQRFIRCYQTISTFTTLSKLGPKQRIPTWKSRVVFFCQATFKVSEFHATSVSAPFLPLQGGAPGVLRWFIIHMN